MQEMSDQEKSVLLAKAMGWTVRDIVGLPADIFAPPDIWVRAGSLYDPANMALAWRVLNWIGTQGLDDIMASWFQEFGCIHIQPSLAQRLWLDKILELAIEAGLVEVEHA